MTDQSHTPLPLSFTESVPSDGFDCFWIKDANGNVVGDVYGPQRVRRQQELARAIVRSVNSLPSLVKALEEIEMETRRGSQWTFEEINECARAALAAYRGEGK